MLKTTFLSWVACSKKASQKTAASPSDPTAKKLMSVTASIPPTTSLLRQVFKWYSAAAREAALNAAPCSFYTAFAKDKGNNRPNDNSTNSTHRDAFQKHAVTEY
jgi:hypothetical protein